VKRAKLKDLITLASEAVNLPDVIEVEGMEVEKYIYLEEDTLVPVILIFSNYISKVLLGKEIFDMPVAKSENSLCFAVIEEDGRDDSEGTDSEAVRVLMIMESMNSIFNLKSKNDVDLTTLVINWRKSLKGLNDGDKIDVENNIKSLIINNMQSIKNRASRKRAND
jgi:hypothetical protein